MFKYEDISLNPNSSLPRILIFLVSNPAFHVAAS